MSFAPGSRIDRYEILSLLGVGGMGEVYLARDLRLDRKVALKLLPLAYTHDAERISRFAQEARAVSALNHPNIITIYEVGEATTAAGRAHFIATEFVEGQTLRQRLKHGPLPPAEAVEIAGQTAGALNAAHAAGVLHRDIKPENIMLRPDGYVKVLDFGLAKLTEERRGEEEERQGDKERKRQEDNGEMAAPSPRRPVAPSDTRPGMVMGTVNYMSPEQARGQGLDGRSDIFSLGIVLYEMLAGRSPFHAATPSDVMAAILQREPPRLLHVADDITPALEQIVHKMLAKDQAARYQSCLELRADLLSLRRDHVGASATAHSLYAERRAEPSSGADAARGGVWAVSAPVRPYETTLPAFSLRAEQGARWPGAGAVGLDPQSYETRAESAAHPTAATTHAEHTSATVILTELKKHKRGVAYALAALLLFASVAGYGVYRLWQGQRPDNFPNMRLTRLATASRVSEAVLSPDGKYVAYTASDGEGTALWVKQTNASGNPLRLIAPGDASFRAPTFARDGNYIFYVTRGERGAGELMSLPTLGGTARRLAAGVSSPVAVSTDGSRLAFVREFPGDGASALIVCNNDGSGEREVARRSLPAAFAIEGASWSPDDRWIACPTTDFTQGVVQNVAAVRVSDGNVQPLTDHAWANVGRVAWLPDGRGVLMIAREPTMQTRQIWLVQYPSRRVRRVTNDLSEYRGLTLTADGTALAALQINQTSNLWIAEAGKLSAGRQLTSSATNGGDGTHGLAWLADGQLVYAASADGKSNLWLANADGASPPRQLTFQGNNNLCAATADGRAILFNSDRNGTVNVWRMNLDGSDARALTDGRLDLDPQATPDGQWVVFSSIRSGKRTLWRVPFGGGAPEQVNTALTEFPVVSPDGRLIACLYRDETGNTRPRIVTVPITGGAPLREFAIPTTPWRLARWSPDGQALTYVVTKDGVSNLWSQPIDGGAARPLTDFRSERIFAFAWSRDGGRLALARGAETRDVVLISNFR